MFTSEWKQKNSLFALCVFRLLRLCLGKQATPTCYAITAAIFSLKEAVSVHGLRLTSGALASPRAANRLHRCLLMLAQEAL